MRWDVIHSWSWNKNPLSHSQYRQFSLDLLLSWCSPIFFGLLIPQEFFHICSLLLNLTILKHPIYFVGSLFTDFSLFSVNLQIIPWDLIFCNKQSPSKYFATKFNLIPLGAGYIVVSCKLKRFISINLCWNIQRDKK